MNPATASAELQDGIYALEHHPFLEGHTPEAAERDTREAKAIYQEALAEQRMVARLFDRRDLLVAMADVAGDIVDDQSREEEITRLRDILRTLRAMNRLAASLSDEVTPADSRILLPLVSKARQAIRDLGGKA